MCKTPTFAKAKLGEQNPKSNKMNSRCGLCDLSGKYFPPIFVIKIRNYETRSGTIG